MKFLDLLLTLLLPSLILLHLLVTPYTKVEESFTIQATHDIVTYGTPFHDIGPILRSKYDHFDFPGAVPRTFIGALVLAGISRPILNVVGSQYGQFVARAVLGLYNSFALLRYKSGVERAFGKSTARWFILLLASQFHVVYYASRTLPNMFAFGLCTLALREFLPIADPSIDAATASKRNRLAIYLLVLAGVIFRSEVAIILLVQLGDLLIRPRMSLQTMVPIGLVSFVIALAISVPIDSYFWQRPIWPELAGFFYNAVQGKSTAWGTSPVHYYFTSLLPKLLLNPLIFLLIPMSWCLPSTRHTTTRHSTSSLSITSLVFIAIYSLQPHKEARFIIYVVPPLTACAALAASYVWTRKLKTWLHLALSIVLVLSILGSFAISTAMLAISSFNYPGGEALWRLHSMVRANGNERRLNVHMDVLSCMTGVTRFQQDSPSYPFPALPSPPERNISEQASQVFLDNINHPTIWHYDKTEDEETLLDPAFWEQFDYVLAERPEKVIGKWDIVGTVYGYAGMQFLRPGDGSSVMELMMSAVNETLSNITSTDEMSGDSSAGVNALMVIDRDVQYLSNDSMGSGEQDMKVVGAGRRVATEEEMANVHVMVGSMLEMYGKKFGVYGVAREFIRTFVTRGWWVGPSIEEKIRILRRAR